ncbi:hypothetical protein SAMN05216550_13516 [Paraburkholderia tropica]|uniref:Uncharacterized protein n=1 Tax=Paraburkholderia tropica TaxID=92647 RepID=A0AAQ1JYH9_9BURK|nr:hypothetical protein SAMN05216550_13516 [Paraburkholderia tropica]
MRIRRGLLPYPHRAFQHRLFIDAFVDVVTTAPGNFNR